MTNIVYASLTRRLHNHFEDCRQVVDAHLVVTVVEVLQTVDIDVRVNQVALHLVVWMLDVEELVLMAEAIAARIIEPDVESGLHKFES